VQRLRPLCAVAVDCVGVTPSISYLRDVLLVLLPSSKVRVDRVRVTGWSYGLCKQNTMVLLVGRMAKHQVHQVGRTGVSSADEVPGHQRPRTRVAEGMLSRFMALIDGCRAKVVRKAGHYNDNAGVVGAEPLGSAAVWRQTSRSATVVGSIERGTQTCTNCAYVRGNSPSVNLKRLRRRLLPRGLDVVVRHKSLLASLILGVPPPGVVLAVNHQLVARRDCEL
jgi:hypothetical protein